MRCPTCQALNPETAEWCSQCYAPLRSDPAPAVPPEPTPPPEPARPTAVPPPADAVGAPGHGRELGDGRFRDGDAGLEWRCQVCQAWNRMDVTTCTVCGTRFGNGLEPVVSPGRDVPDTTVMAASAVLPGLGHILLGRKVAGWSRLLTWALWFAGGLWLLLEARAVEGSVLPAVPLLLGTVVIWVSAPLDSHAVRVGSRDEILRPRVFLWLVVAVLGTLMIAFLAAATALPGGLG